MSKTSNKHNPETNSSTNTSASPTVCACGNTKRTYKPTCTFCSFIEYIRGTKDTIPTMICACGSFKEPGALSCSACNKALENYLELRIKNEGKYFNKTKFMKCIHKNHGIGVAGKCSLCGENYIFGGNNPQPVIDDFDARCCETCDKTVVISARVAAMKEEFGDNIEIQYLYI